MPTSSTCASVSVTDFSHSRSPATCYVSTHSVSGLNTYTSTPAAPTQVSAAPINVTQSTTTSISSSHTAYVPTDSASHTHGLLGSAQPGHPVFSTTSSSVSQHTTLAQCFTQGEYDHDRISTIPYNVTFPNMGNAVQARDTWAYAWSSLRTGTERVQDSSVTPPHLAARISTSQPNVAIHVGTPVPSPSMSRPYAQAQEEATSQSPWHQRHDALYTPFGFQTSSTAVECAATAAARAVVQETGNRANTTQDMPVPHDSTSSMGTQAQLPKLQLPKFSGQLLEWAEFWGRVCGNRS